MRFSWGRRFKDALMLCDVLWLPKLALSFKALSSLLLLQRPTKLSPDKPPMFGLQTSTHPYHTADSHLRGFALNRKTNLSTARFDGAMFSLLFLGCGIHTGIIKKRSILFLFFFCFESSFAILCGFKCANATRENVKIIMTFASDKQQQARTRAKTNWINNFVQIIRQMLVCAISPRYTNEQIAVMKV